MNFLRWLYLNTSGRVSRTVWWLAMIALAAVSLGIGNLLELLLEGELRAAMSGDGQYRPSLILDLIYPVGSLLHAAATCLFGYCVGVKRRHDKNGSGWDVAVLFGLPVTLSLLRAVERLLATLGSIPVPDNGGIPSVIALIGGVLYYLFAIYVLVMLAFVRGSPADNDYGPNPRHVPRAAATS